MTTSMLNLAENSTAVQEKAVEEQPKESLYNLILKWEGMGKEGKPGKAYLEGPDGILTIGVGHKVLSYEKDENLKKVIGNKKEDYDKYVNGEVALTDKQMKQLFDLDSVDKINIAKDLFKNYEHFPTDLQNALVSGVYRGEFKEGHETVRLINDGEFAAAADEYLDRDDYRKAKKDGINRGIIARMDSNAKVMKKYAIEIAELSREDPLGLSSSSSRGVSA
jgi:GH24 family phage-related lysozyme (muramidase)